MSLREKGNDKYRKGDIEGALVFYRQAHDGGDELASQNISAALFELGQYDESISAGLKALQSFGNNPSEDNTRRASKIKLRIAKAYVVRREYEKAKDILAQVSKSGDPGFEMKERICKILEMHDTMNSVGSQKSAEQCKLPMIEGLIRSSSVTVPFVFHQWSHGSPFSMIEGPEVQKQSELLTRDAAGNTQTMTGEGLKYKKFRFDMVQRAKKKQITKIFSGGFGDGRHVFETLRDISLQMNKEKAKNLYPEVHFLLNDVRVEAVARVVVMCMLFYELGGHKKDLVMTYENGFTDDKNGRILARKATKKSQKRILNDKEYADAMETATLVYHTYVSPCLLPHHQKRVMAVCQRLADASSPPCAWLKTTSAKVWERLRTVFRYWASDPANWEEYERYILIPEQLKKRKAAAMKEKNVGHSIAGTQMAASLGVPEGTSVIRVSSEIMQQMSKSGNMASGTVGKKLKAAMSARQDSIMDTDPEGHLYTNEMPSLNSKLEEDLVRREKVVAPPAELWAKYPEHVLLSKRNERSKNPTRRVWSPNVITMPLNLTSEPCPAVLDLDSWSYDHVLENVSNISALAMDNYTLRRSWFDHVSFWFVEVAQVLKRLADNGKLVLEFDIGDMHALAVCQEPESFDVVNLSNVQDYTHLLNAIACFPRLLSQSQESTSFMIHDIRLVPEAYENLMEYVHSNTLLTSLSECERALNLKLLGGRLYGPLPHWTVNKAKLLSRAEFEAWLVRLLLAIAYPPCTRVSGPHFEIWGATMVTFFEILVRAVEIGYPKHWIGQFVEKVSRDEVKSFVRAPLRSPNPVVDTYDSFSNKIRHVPLESIVADFQAVLGYYMKARLPIGICTPVSESCWFSFKKCLPTLKYDHLAYGMTFPTVGFVVLLGGPAGVMGSSDRLGAFLKACREDPDMFSTVRIKLFSVVKWKRTRDGAQELSVFFPVNTWMRMKARKEKGFLVMMHTYTPLAPLIQIPIDQSVPEN